MKSIKKIVAVTLVTAFCFIALCVPSYASSVKSDFSYIDFSDRGLFVPSPEYPTLESLPYGGNTLIFEIPKRIQNAFVFHRVYIRNDTDLSSSYSVWNGTIVFPTQYIDEYLTFTTSGNLFNVSNSTINCIIFLNGTQYSARFQSFGTLQYRTSSSSYYEYVDIVTGDIADTNVVFTTASERINDNYYFDKYQIAVLSILIAILFFVFLGWFLWHKR